MIWPGGFTKESYNFYSEKTKIDGKERGKYVTIEIDNRNTSQCRVVVLSRSDHLAIESDNRSFAWLALRIRLENGFTQMIDSLLFQLFLCFLYFLRWLARERRGDRNCVEASKSYSVDVVFVFVSKDFMESQLEPITLEVFFFLIAFLLSIV